MGNWDSYEEEQSQREELKVKFTINFKKMSHYLGRIDEETQEWDEKHPKDSILMMWGSIMFCLLVLFTLSHSIFMLATVPFVFFYLYVLVQMFRVWKRFKYSKGTFLGMTIPTVIVMLVLGVVLQNLIF